MSTPAFCYSETDTNTDTATDTDTDTAVQHHRPLHVLLAESSANLRRVLAFVLRRHGHRVTTAVDGSELLEAIASLIIAGDHQQHDVIVASHLMPGIPGLSVLAGLRSRGRQTPFILLTDDPAIQERARDLNGIILDGPLNVSSIRRAVHQAELTANQSRM